MIMKDYLIRIHFENKPLRMNLNLGFQNRISGNTLIIGFQKTKTKIVAVLFFLVLKQKGKFYSSFLYKIKLSELHSLWG